MYSDDIQSKLKEINDYIGEEYKLTHPKDKRDLRTYNQQFSRRVSTAMKMLGWGVSQRRNDRVDSA